MAPPRRSPERVQTPDDPDPTGREVDSLVIISGGWKLIKNTGRPEGWPDDELSDHEDDPLDPDDVSDENPESVARLKDQLER